MRILSILLSKRANLVLFSILCSVGFSSSMSTGLTPAQISRIGEFFSMGSSVRPMRSAEAFPQWPGVKLGVEVTFQPTQVLNGLGNGDGTLPDYFPMPRFYLAKGLGNDFELILGTFPFASVNTIASYGALLKWTVRPEDENWLAVAVYAGYTRMSALSTNLKGNTFEGGVIISKDYVRIRPYFGAAGAYTSSTVDPAFALAPTLLTGSEPRIKLFVGCEFELPLNLGVQVDFLGWRPTASLFIGQQW